MFITQLKHIFKADFREIKKSVILRGLATSNEVCNLLLHHGDLILNEFGIYNIWRIWGTNFASCLV